MMSLQIKNELTEDIRFFSVCGLNSVTPREKHAQNLGEFFPAHANHHKFPSRMVRYRKAGGQSRFSIETGNDHIVGPKFAFLNLKDRG